MKCIAFSALLLLFTAGGFARNDKDGQYISQETIDTSILKAFVLLNASADMAGVGFGHRRSLAEAKKIAHKLKSRAKGDPNERYVLWKVGELEAQIYLEERDMVLQQMQKRQLTINELVDKYNLEVGKWRPDFGTLYRIHKNMDQVDATKAGELADSYNTRKNALSREVVYFLEKALLAGKLEKAQKELGYLLRNQMYLNVSARTYKQLEGKVEGLFLAREISPLVRTGVRSAEQLLGKMDIVKARKTLDSTENKLVTIKKYLSQGDAATLSTLLNRGKRKLGQKEDSLVNVNIAILRSEGVDAADRYLQKVLRPYGVSREKAARVDRMIISVASPDAGSSSSALDGLDVEEEDVANPAMDDVLFAARKKARVRMDSIRAIDDARLWEERRDKARRDSINQVARAVEEARYKRSQARVDSVTMRIYNLLEKNNPTGAEKLLAAELSFLKSTMRPDDYSMLKTTVVQFTSFAVSAQKEIEYISQVATAPGAAEPADDGLAAPPPQDMEANRHRAQVEILGIYTLLEENKIGRAYKRFQTNKIPLRKYLEPEVYGMLEVTIVQAYQFYSSQQ